MPNSRTFLSALLACTLLGAPSVRAQGTFRIEVHPIVSLDADAAQALQGKFEGPSRTVAGELRLPFTDEVRVPAVVFLHGDAGAVSNQPVWIDKLIAMGIAVFTVDSFTGRGAIGQQPSIMIGGRLPTPLMRVPDAPHRRLRRHRHRRRSGTCGRGSDSRARADVLQDTVCEVAPIAGLENIGP